MDIDWQYIKIPLLVLFGTVIISFTVILFSSWHEDSIMNEYYLTEKKFNTAKRQYEEANRNRTLYENYLTNYINYINNGIIGEEQRLNWIEELQNIDKSLNLASLVYEIEPKKPVALDGVNNSNNHISLYQSKMNITTDVLHEKDFFTLLEALRINANGFFTLSECDMTSKIGSNIPRFMPNAGNLMVKCDMGWLTVKVNE